MTAKMQAMIDSEEYPIVYEGKYLFSGGHNYILKKLLRISCITNTCTKHVCSLFFVNSITLFLSWESAMLPRIPIYNMMIIKMTMNPIKLMAPAFQQER
jgi:hypothetical protein